MTRVHFKLIWRAGSGFSAGRQVSVNGKQSAGNSTGVRKLVSIHSNLMEFECIGMIHCFEHHSAIFFFFFRFVFEFDSSLLELVATLRHYTRKLALFLAECSVGLLWSHYFRRLDLTLTWFAQTTRGRRSAVAIVTFLWSVDALRRSFWVCLWKISGDVSGRLKHKWLMVWCSAVVQLTPVQIYEVRQDGVSCMWECFCCTHVVWLSMVNQSAASHHWMRVCKKNNKNEKRTWIIHSKYPDMWDPDASWERTVATFFFSLQLDDSIWSIDVNELELICFKYPLKVNWHCWNRCICVWHCGQHCCFSFFLYVNKESS